MNALPAWDDEQRLAAAPAPDSTPYHALDATAHVHDTDALHDSDAQHDSDAPRPEAASADGASRGSATAATGLSDLFPADLPDGGIPGAGRGAALAAALHTLDVSGGLADAVRHLLAAVDAADADAGIVRVDTRDVLLQQRIARIVSGTGLPSRGPGTRARDILSLLLGSRAA